MNKYIPAGNAFTECYSEQVLAICNLVLNDHNDQELDESDSIPPENLQQLMNWSNEW